MEVAEPSASEKGHIRQEILKRAGGQCECRYLLRHPNGRCELEVPTKLSDKPKIVWKNRFAKKQRDYHESSFIVICILCYNEKHYLHQPVFE